MKRQTTGVMKQKPVAGVKKIARMAQVSIATVDRVLHNRPGVAPRTKSKIEQIIKDLDYKPNIIASRLASRDEIKIAVLIPKVSQETNFWQAPLEGIRQAEEMVEEYGIKINLYLYDLNDRVTFSQQADKIIEDKPEGILIAPLFIKEGIGFTALCSKLNIPFVLIDSNIPEHEGLCYIGPHQFRSGFLSAQIMNFTLSKNSKILIMNIANEVDDLSYLKEIEEGFRAYFKYYNLRRDLLKLELSSADNQTINKVLDNEFENHPNLRSVFVTNSRVSIVARYLKRTGRKKVFLLGYDYTEENIELLKKDMINVLICHKSKEQGYAGIMSLYRHLILKEEVEHTQFMPIDIITKENCEFYNN